MGLGASSYKEGIRWKNTSDMKSYLSQADTGQLVRVDEERLSVDEQMEEFMFLGLRLRSGISKAEFAQRFGIPIEEIYGDVIRRYKELALLQEENGRIFLSRHGIHVSNTVMADFLL